MCIIVYKPAGVPLVDRDILWNCFTSNPDGMGYMTVKDGKVVISKGQADSDQLADELERQITPDEPVIYHFRIGTSGKKNTTNCHPFPIVGDVAWYEHPLITAGAGFAHNGILPSKLWNNKELSEICDSGLFVRDLLYPLYNKWRSMEQFLELAAVESTSRFALMLSTGQVGLYGNNWHEEDGLKFSNLSYVPLSRNLGSTVSWRLIKCPECSARVWLSQGLGICKECGHVTIPDTSLLEICPNCWNTSFQVYADGDLKCFGCGWRYSTGSLTEGEEEAIINVLEDDDVPPTIECWVCDEINSALDSYCVACNVLLEEPDWE